MSRKKQLEKKGGEGGSDRVVVMIKTFFLMPVHNPRGTVISDRVSTIK